MAFIKVWVHYVWTTKKRQSFLTENVKSKVIAHMKENALKKRYIFRFNQRREAPFFRVLRV